MGHERKDFGRTPRVIVLSPGWLGFVAPIGFFFALPLGRFLFCRIPREVCPISRAIYRSVRNINRKPL